MVSEQSKSSKVKEKPWDRYRQDPQYLLLEPGWAGTLDDDELKYIQEILMADPDLSFWWGFRQGQKTRSEAAIKRVALFGDPDKRGRNRELARPRTERPNPAPEGSFSDTRNFCQPDKWSLGHPTQFQMSLFE